MQPIDDFSGSFYYHSTDFGRDGRLRRQAVEPTGSSMDLLVEACEHLRGCRTLAQPWSLAIDAGRQASPAEVLRRVAGEEDFVTASVNLLGEQPLYLLWVVPGDVIDCLARCLTKHRHGQLGYVTAFEVPQALGRLASSLAAWMALAGRPTRASQALHATDLGNEVLAEILEGSQRTSTRIHPARIRSSVVQLNAGHVMMASLGD